MSKERELLKQAIYFLEPLDWEANVQDTCQNLINETKELLAQTETKQEPVAWQLVAKFITDGDILQYTYSKPRDELYEYYRVTPLYASPPAREPLSDEDLKTIAVEEEFLLFCSEDEFVEIARAIEKARGIGQ